MRFVIRKLIENLWWILFMVAATIALALWG